MRKQNQGYANRLEDIPNIGRSIASDLRSIGILDPQQLATRDPFEVYLALPGSMGHRHDPCVLSVREKKATRLIHLAEAASARPNDDGHEKSCQHAVFA